MPLGSRFQSERLRFVALSLLMVTVLSVTVIAAKLYTRYIDVLSRPPLELKSVGLYRVGGPIGWEPVTDPVEPVEGLRTLGYFDEPARNGRRLGYYQLRTRNPLTPAAALAGVLHRMRAEIIKGSKPQLFRTSTLFGIAVQAMGQSEKGAMEKHLIAVLTLDARRYLVIDLSGQGRPNRYDSPLLARLTAAVQTQRYRVVESPLEFNHDIGLVLADHLLAVEPTRADTGHYLIVPATGLAQFAMIDTVAIDISKPLVGPEGVPDDSPMPARLKQMLISDQLNPSQRIVVGMTLRYWQLTGRLPPATAFQNFADGRGLAMVVPTGTEVLSKIKGLDAEAGKGLELHRSLHVLRLDGKRAIMLDLLAEPQAREYVEKEAQNMVLNLYDVNVGPPPERPQAPPRDAAPNEENDDR
ncbi:MAG: hypothetical protein ACYTGQ_07050 [Planctomycetota bacterium]|jgi:hypothetical protein